MNKYLTPQFEEKIKKACKSHKSMAAACASLNMHFNTFKKHAIRLGVYNTNQSGKGLPKEKPITPINDIIIKGLHPQYQSHKLKLRLIKEGIKSHKCENCNKSKWLNKPIPLELEHIDGNRYNHKIDNLKLLCPNCHAFTSTYRGKNTKHYI